MSDENFRPTYTSTDIHGAYNATQVRLYGVPGPSFQPGLQLPKSIKGKPIKPALADAPEVVTGYMDKWDLAFALVKGAGAGGNDAQAVMDAVEKGFGGGPRPVKSSFVFIKSTMRQFMIMLGAVDISPDQEDNLSAGIIFGYAYEGHCYDLPKPKLMLIPTRPQPKFPPDDSGYDKKFDAGYRVWIVDKLDQCIDIEVNQGFVEQLVLEANLPGKRSPTMYAGRMLLGHKSGRLTE